MTAKITASTSSGLVLDSDMSGSLALVANGITVATLNGTGANAGIQMGTSMAPAFSAYMGTVSFTHNTDTKIPWNSELFDTNGNYDSTTNYRFTPTVAGFYYVTVVIRNSGTASRQYDNTLTIKKNGTTVIYYENSFAMGSGQVSGLSASGIVYLNGTSDYLESYFNPYDYTSGGAVSIYGGNSLFQACLIRSA